MALDVIITPASGLVDFQNSGISSATIQLDGSGNLNIASSGGDIQIGDTSSDVYIGDGVNNVDLVFEQDGEIRGLTGKTITLGQSDSYVKINAGLKDSNGVVGTAGSVLSSDGSLVEWVTPQSGAQGIQGISGTQGTTGAQGTTGTQGISGVNYTKGVTTYTATQDQTTFSATYTVGLLDVYLNGVRLSGNDYTATNGTSVVLTSAANLGDVIDLITYTGGVTGAQGIQGIQGIQGAGSEINLDSLTLNITSCLFI
jgi:hypothetical protein